MQLSFTIDFINGYAKKVTALDIKLNDLIRAFEQADEIQSYVDIENGTVVAMGQTFDGCDHFVDETEEERLAKVFSIEDDWERYIMLPDVYEDIRLYMEEFAKNEAANGNIELAHILENNGSLINFNRRVKALALHDSWRRFLYEKLADYARFWCEENGINYVE